MHDSWSRLAADRGPIAAAAEKRVDQGAGVVAGRRVNDHARRFVDYRDVLVLINDVERNRLCSGLDDVGLGDLEVDDVPGRHPVGRVGRTPVEEGKVAFDQSRGGRAAQVRRALGQESIEPGRRGLRDQAAGVFRNR